MGAGYHGGFGNTKGSAHNNESANTPKKESRADLISELRKNNIKFCIRSYNLNLTYYNSKAFLQEVFPFFFLQECLDFLKPPY